MVARYQRSLRTCGLLGALLDLHWGDHEQKMTGEQVQALEDGAQVPALKDGEHIQGLEDGKQVQVLEDVKQVQGLEAASRCRFLRTSSRSRPLKTAGRCRPSNMASGYSALRTASLTVLILSGRKKVPDLLLTLPWVLEGRQTRRRIGP